MSSKKILLEQLATDSNLLNKHTVIIKKPFVLLPLSTQQHSKSPPRRLKPLRSRSQNSHPRKNLLPVPMKQDSIQNSPRFQITSRHKIIKTEHKRSQFTVKNDISTLQYNSHSIVPQDSAKNKNNLKDYLHFIRAMPQQFYQISANFQSLRKRNRRQSLKSSQKQLFQFIVSIFVSIYKNLEGKGKQNSQAIFDSCQTYFGCFQKIKLQIIFSIYYPNNLHTKLRPFIVYERLIMFSISAFTINHSIQKLSNSNKQSLKLVVQLLIEAYAGLFQPIKQQETQVVSNINQTFRLLKAIGEVEKKMQIIQKEMRKINANREVFIEQELKSFVNGREQWSMQRLSQKQMKISWDYLKIPPVPYLPSKSTFKAYTLVLQLDHTLIYYDKETKILKYRPFIDFFLHKVSQNYEIVAFTKADHKYASVLIGQIQRNTRFFNYILCKQHLSYSSDGRLIKDISRLGRELKTLVIVDYLPTIYKNYSMNGLAINSWFGDKSDKQLQRISFLLQSIVVNSVQDIRSFIHDHNEKSKLSNNNNDKQ